MGQFTGRAGEVHAAAARLGLIVAALVLMVRELYPPMTSLREGWRGFEAGLEGRVGVFLLQFVLLALAFAVFYLVPTWAVASLVAEESRALATAIVLAVRIGRAHV